LGRGKPYLDGDAIRGGDQKGATLYRLRRLRIKELLKFHGLRTKGGEPERLTTGWKKLFQCEEGSVGRSSKCTRASSKKKQKEGWKEKEERGVYTCDKAKHMQSPKKH